MPQPFKSGGAPSASWGFDVDLSFLIGCFSDPEDRFITLGYLAQAFCDAGDYDTMLHYSQLQMELANERHDEYMKSEAFLNLAKTYERLADFSKVCIP